MKKFPMLAALLACLATSPLHAQAYVSNTGVDTRDCLSAANACATFQRAYAQTNSGVQAIVVLTPSDSYSLLTIGKSLSIVAANGSIPIFNARIVIEAGADDDVYIEGLQFDGLNGSRIYGVRMNSGRMLHIKNSRFSNFRGGPDYSGVIFAPTGASNLAITDTVLSLNGSGATGAGLLVKPSGGGSARVTLNGVSAENNVFGIAVDGSGSTGGINMTVTDSVLASNVNDGLVATTSSAPMGILLTNVKSTNNTFGVRSLGSGTTVRVEHSKIIGNGTGLTAASGGALLSAGNNVVEANGSNGAFTGSLAFK